jgi:hypothetical protein
MMGAGGEKKKKEGDRRRRNWKGKLEGRRSGEAAGGES